MIDSRLGCSTISFRHLELVKALGEIANLGPEAGLGSLCVHPRADHAEYLGRGARRHLRGEVGSVGPIHQLRRRGPERSRRRGCEPKHLTRLLELAAEVGARALVLPNGAIEHTPIENLGVDLDRVAANVGIAREVAQPYGIGIWIESLHMFRLCCNQRCAAALTSRLPPEVGIVMDFSHIVAAGDHRVQFVETFGPRITHVHIRDATRGRIELDPHPSVDEPGNISLSVGRGEVDFDAGISALRSSTATTPLSSKPATSPMTNAPQRPRTLRT